MAAHEYDGKTIEQSEGAYKNQIRWHLPNRPNITGKVARLDYGQSPLFIDTVLPANANLVVVDERKNPDPCDGSAPGCVQFGANARRFASRSAVLRTRYSLDCELGRHRSRPIQKQALEIPSRIDKSVKDQPPRIERNASRGDI
ncbi:MAG TPA: hypothetical protein VII12_03215 [Thermoanaerobaculia bacterium]